MHVDQRADGRAADRTALRLGRLTEQAHDLGVVGLVDDEPLARLVVGDEPPDVGRSLPGAPLVQHPAPASRAVESLSGVLVAQMAASEIRTVVGVVHLRELLRLLGVEPSDQAWCAVVLVCLDDVDAVHDSSSGPSDCLDDGLGGDAAIHARIALVVGIGRA